MEESRELEFIDQAKPVENKVDETTRRSFLAKVSGIAAITAMAPTAFARNFIDKYDPDGPLGAVCDPTNPASIGAAVRSILDLDAAARADLRARCRRAATTRHDWPTQLATLLEVYSRVTGRAW